MTIRFRCKCGRKFEVADSAAGRKARCTDCGLTFLVPSPNAQPAPAAAPPDNSPLAQAARAAQAAAAVHASPAARPAQAKQPAAGQAARPHAHRPAPRPAAPPPAHRPAPPPAHRPAAQDTMYALQDDDDDVPMARLAPVRVHYGPHKAKLTAVQAVAGISTVIALVVIVDSVATMLGAVQAGAKGMELVYGGAAIFAGIGVIVALTAGVGSRVCIGILLGGAARNVLNGPVLLFLAFSKNEMVTSQGKDAVMICGVAGVASLLAGVVYLLAPLLSRPVRKYIGAQYGIVIGGGMVGLLLGPLIVSSALPSPELLWARSVTARRVQASTAAGPGGVSKVLTPKQQTETREAMMDQMKDIHKALDAYFKKRRRLPLYMGQLVSDDCPIQLFFSPAREAKPHRDPGGGDIKDSDVIYLFKDSRSASQLESIPNAAELIVAYSGPGCGLGEGAIVMRLPSVSVAAPVEWLDKPALDKQLAATNKWLKDNPPPEKDNAPEKLPGFEVP